MVYDVANADDVSDISISEKQLAGLPDDTAKVNLLVKLGEKYCSKENDKALMYLQEAYTLATSLHYRKGIGKSLLWQGRVYYYKDNYRLAIGYLGKAKSILVELNDTDDLAFLYFAEAAVSGLRGDYIHTAALYKKSIALSEQTGNKKLMSTSYSSIGTIMLTHGEAEKSLEYFNEALAIKKSINHRAGISNVYTGMANAYESLDMPDSALKYHNKALKIRTELNNDRAIANSEYNRAGVLIKWLRISIIPIW